MRCKRAASRRRLRRPPATAKTSAGVTGYTILLVAQKPGQLSSNSCHKMLRL